MRAAFNNAGGQMNITNINIPREVNLYKAQHLNLPL